MPEMILLLHLVTAVASLGVIVGFLALRRGVLQSLRHQEVDRILASLSEVQKSVYDLSGEMGNFREQYRRELDNMHERLEYLEQVDRERQGREARNG